MANQVEITITADPKNAEAGFKRTQSAFGKMTDGIKKHRKAIGVGLAAIGAGITGLAGLAVKSSLEQQVGINRLDQALKNVGQSYDDQRAAIEEVISAQQRKTNFGDEAQRDALQKLVTIGGQWEGTLDALKITTDVAAGANIDLSAAALLVGKAIAGETSSLSRYGILLEEGATRTEIMAALIAQFGGAAEAAADPLTQLKNRLGDMLQVVGDVLLPMVSRAAVAIEWVTRKVIEWAEAHPGLARILAVVGAAVGGLTLVLGPLLIILPSLIAGISAMGVAITIATGPVGIITLAIAALVAGTILLLKNWDTVWDAIKATTEKTANFIIDLLNRVTFVYRNMIAKMLEGVRAVVGFIPKIGDSMGESLTKAIDALKEGVPQIDITAEKMEEFGEVSEAAAKKIVASEEEIRRAIAITAEERAAAEERQIQKLKDSVAFERAIRLKNVDFAIAANNRALAAKRQNLAEITAADQAAAAVSKTTAERIRDEAIAADLARIDKLEQNELNRFLRGEAANARELAAAEALAADLLAIQDQLFFDLATFTSKSEGMFQRLQQQTMNWRDSWDDQTASILFNLSGQGMAFRDLGGTVQSVVQAMNTVTAKSAEDIIAGWQRQAQVGETLQDTIKRLATEGKLDFISLAAAVGLVTEGLNDLSRAAGRVPTIAESSRGSIAESSRGSIAGVKKQILGLMGADQPVPQTLLSLLNALEVQAESNLPVFIGDKGGVVPGPIGAAVPAILHGGETVTPVSGRGGGRMNLNITVNNNGVIGVEDLGDTVAQIVRDKALGGAFYGVPLGGS